MARLKFHPIVLSILRQEHAKRQNDLAAFEKARDREGVERITNVMQQLSASIKKHELTPEARKVIEERRKKSKQVVNGLKYFLEKAEKPGNEKINVNAVDALKSGIRDHSQLLNATSSALKMKRKRK